MKLGIGIYAATVPVLCLSIGTVLGACSASQTKTAINVSKLTLDVGDAICQVLETDPNVPD